ncbi:MAG: YadA-like family protein [Phascolarctobacterium sp.]|nr:YadA-like family protein [Phascolarctobacterium sp.]
MMKLNKSLVKAIMLTLLVGGLGISNVASANTAAGSNSAIGFGHDNTIESTGPNSYIGAGYTNIISGSSSFIGAGSDNVASGQSSGVVAGTQNQAIGQNTGVLAGYHNLVYGTRSVIVGGVNNTTGANGEDVGQYSFIGAGSGNTVTGTNAVVVGGSNNKNYGTGSFIGGGASNVINSSTTFTGSFIGGGSNNTTVYNLATVVGGAHNTATGSYSFVGGGYYNKANGTYSVVVGGGDRNGEAMANVADGQYTFVGGGRNNKAYGLGSLIVGGSNNTAGVADTEANVDYHATILGGVNNTAAGKYSVVLGNNATANNDYDVAIGYKAETGEAHTGDTAKKVSLAGTEYTYAGPATTGIGTISVGSAGNEHQIQNVAAGDITATSTDAVNGSQLFAVVDYVSNLSSSGTVININDGTYVKKANGVGENINALDTQVAQNAQDIATNKDNIAANTQAINNLSNSISGFDKKINRSGANAAALAALHPVDDGSDSKLNIAVGGGHYHNANAFALGLFYKPTDRVQFNIGASTGGGEHMANIGASFALDRNVPKTYSSKKAMAETIKANEAKIQQLTNEVNELKALVKQLANKK